MVFDYIAIGTVSLDDGVRELQNRLNVDIPFGVPHPCMSTNNCWARLGADSFHCAPPALCATR